MNTKTLILATVAAVFALGATAPSYAAEKQNKLEKRIHRLVKRADQNGDARVSKSELAAAVQLAFQTVDTDNDGGLSADEIANQRKALKAQRKEVRVTKVSAQRAIRLPKSIGKHFDKLDANNDGVLSEGEISRVASRMFKRGDKNNDGYISAADIGA